MVLGMFLTCINQTEQELQCDRRLIMNRSKKSTENRREAISARLTAAAYARLGDNMGVEMHLATADYLDEEANKLLMTECQPEIRHGEALPDSRTTKDVCMRETLAQHPDQIALEASYNRLGLLMDDRLDVLALGIDAAASADSANSLEKMLAHQLALAHKSAFEMVAKAMEFLGMADSGYGQSTNTEGVRLMNAATRMMNTYQQGLLTLNKLRKGGSQTITIQHVHVADGAQAIIGSVKSGKTGGVGE
jgi:hypothetical protein